MANEKRLIDANAALEKICEYCNCGCYEECDYRCSEFDNISNIPTVDAVEVVHGYNIDRDTPSLFECSVCHWSCWDTYCGDTDDYNYCPNCGAKMDGDGNV